MKCQGNNYRASLCCFASADLIGTAHPPKEEAFVILRGHVPVPLQIFPHFSCASQVLIIYVCLSLLDLFGFGPPKIFKTYKLNLFWSHKWTKYDVRDQESYFWVHQALYSLSVIQYHILDQCNERYL